MAPESLAVQARKRFLGFHEVLRDIIGQEYRPYKGLETDLWDRAFAVLIRSRKRGAAWLCEALARLARDQALPNVNHRTALGFLQAVLAHNGVQAPWVARGRMAGFDASTHAWMKKSKTIMADRDMWNVDSEPWNELREKTWPRPATGWRASINREV